MSARWSREELVLLLRAWDDVVTKCSTPPRTRPTAADVAVRFEVLTETRSSGSQNEDGDESAVRTQKAVEEKMQQLQRMFFCIVEYQLQQKKKTTSPTPAMMTDRQTQQLTDKDDWFALSHSEQSEFFLTWDSTVKYPRGMHYFAVIDAEVFTAMQRVMEKQLAITFARDVPWTDDEVRAVVLAWREATDEKDTAGTAAEPLDSKSFYRRFQAHCGTSGNLRDQATVARKLYAVVGMHQVITKFGSLNTTPEDCTTGVVNLHDSWFASSAVDKFRFFMEVDGRSYLFVDIAQDVFEVIDKVIERRNALQNPSQYTRSDLEDGEVEEDCCGVSEDGGDGSHLEMVFPSAAVHQNSLLSSENSSPPPKPADLSGPVETESRQLKVDSPRCADVNSCEDPDPTDYTFIVDSPRNEDMNPSQALYGSLLTAATDSLAPSSATAIQMPKAVSVRTTFATSASDDLAGDLAGTLLQEYEETGCNDEQVSRETAPKKRKLDPDLQLVINIFNRQVQHIGDLVHQIREEREVERAEREKFLALCTKITRTGSETA